MSASQLTPDAPFYVFMNRGSGSDDPRETQTIIRSVLEDAGRAYELEVVEDPSRLRETATRLVDRARADGGAVVVAGGDGTIRTAAQAALEGDCPFGVLPGGTFNFFSRAHGIPTETAAAVRMLLTARIQPVQVGLINGQVFLVNASLGLYPEVLEEREGYKRRFGRNRLVALWSGVLTLLREHERLHIELRQQGEATSVDTYSLFVGNNRLQIERVGVEEADELDAGRLVAILLKPISPARMLRLMVLSALGRLSASPDVVTFTLEQLKVGSSRHASGGQAKVAVDGEIIRLSSPIELSVAPHPLRLLGPPDSAVSPHRPSHLNSGG